MPVSGCHPYKQQRASMHSIFKTIVYLGSFWTTVLQSMLAASSDWLARIATRADLSLTP